MLQRAGLNLRLSLRRFSTASQCHIEDEGDWTYTSEWWANQYDGQTVFRSTSDKGNGIVTVSAYPSSRPDPVNWPSTERWLNQRYAEINPRDAHNGNFKILGYQWRTLRFNDNSQENRPVTQSTAKVMAAYRASDPGSVCLMQQPHCLTVPYPKSMVAAGLAAMLSCNYDLKSVIFGKQTMNILCIGHGGGSLPLFLASKLQGAVIDIVEIDPVVVSASTQAMGFPSFSVMTASGDRVQSKPNPVEEVLWKGIHERLFLHESDAENFVLESEKIYDMVFMDAYDGEDVFPNKLWCPDSPFLRALGKRMHPKLGVVVVNLHADNDIMHADDGSVRFIVDSKLPTGKYASEVCEAYKNAIVGNGNAHERRHGGSGLAFTVSVPWVCNASLVVCRDFGCSSEMLDRDIVLNSLIHRSVEVDSLLELPFSCLQYIKRGFTLY